MRQQEDELLQMERQKVFHPGKSKRSFWVDKDDSWGLVMTDVDELDGLGEEHIHWLDEDAMMQLLSHTRKNLRHHGIMMATMTGYPLRKGGSKGKSKKGSKGKKSTVFAFQSSPPKRQRCRKPCKQTRVYRLFYLWRQGTWLQIMPKEGSGSGNVLSLSSGALC